MTNTISIPVIQQRRKISIEREVIIALGQRFSNLLATEAFWEAKY